MATLADLFKTCYLTSGNGVEFSDYPAALPRRR